MACVGATVLALLHQQLDLSIYLLGGAHASANDLFAVTSSTDHLGFTYPPFSALLFAPFAHFPLRACEVVFSWVNLAALFALIVVSLRAVCTALDKRTVVWWALALVLPVLLFDPVRQTFLLGQVNIILALMVVADLTMDLPLPRGILVGLAAAIKVTPIILIPYLFLTRQGRAGLRAIASFAQRRCWPLSSTAPRRGPTGPTTSVIRSVRACCRGSGTRVCWARPSACSGTRSRRRRPS